MILQEQRDVLHGLRQLAFETESENSLSHERRRSLCAKEFKKLGFSVSYCCQKFFHCASPEHLLIQLQIHDHVYHFDFTLQNNSNPGQDLVRTPPGLLALDTMYYFAKRYPDVYSRVSIFNMLYSWQVHPVKKMNDE